MLPDVSIIIVNWNTRDLLLNCLDSIRQNKNNLNVEVIVVDNSSTDDSQVLVQQRFPQTRLIANRENVGFARANNQALAIGQGRYFLLLNSDTIVLPGTLEKLVAIADKYPHAGIVGCRLLNADGSLQESWARFPTFWSELWGHNFRSRRLVEKMSLVYEVDWVGGACMLVRPAAISEVGLLDESFFMYSEETDWCFRLWQHGWHVYYLASAEIIHLGGGSASRVSAAQLIRLYEGKLRFFAKHYGARQAALLRYGLVFVNVIGIFRRVIIWVLQRQRWEEVRPWLTARWQFIGQLLWGQPTGAS